MLAALVSCIRQNIDLCDGRGPDVLVAGRLVTATFLLQLTSKGSSAGATVLTGLPLASIASPVLGILSVGWATALAGVSGTVIGTVPSGGQAVTLYSASGGNSTSLGNGSFANTSQAMGAVTYEVYQSAAPTVS